MSLNCATMLPDPKLLNMGRKTKILMRVRHQADRLKRATLTRPLTLTVTDSNKCKLTFD